VLRREEELRIERQTSEQKSSLKILEEAVKGKAEASVQIEKALAAKANAEAGSHAKELALTTRQKEAELANRIRSLEIERDIEALTERAKAIASMDEFGQGLHQRQLELDHEIEKRQLDNLTREKEATARAEIVGASLANAQVQVFGADPTFFDAISDSNVKAQQIKNSFQIVKLHGG
jgi:L-fucose isomerase-like protein